jgi:hypothetical protein
MGVGAAVIYSVLYAVWNRAGRYMRKSKLSFGVIHCVSKIRL